MKCHKRGIICEEVALVQALEELKTVGFVFWFWVLFWQEANHPFTRGKKYRGNSFQTRQKGVWSV